MCVRCAEIVRDYDRTLQATICRKPSIIVKDLSIFEAPQNTIQVLSLKATVFHQKVDFYSQASPD